MKFGAEDKKKVMFLGVLMVVAAGALYFNVLSDPTPSPGPSPSAAGLRNADLDSATGTAPAVTPTARATSTQPRPIVNRNSKGDEWQPVMHKKNARPDEQQIDPSTIDPSIHLELLAKVQNMKLEGGQRNLFQFGAAAPVELPKDKEPIVLTAKVFDYPRPLPPKVVVPPPPPPPATPPSFKYYGLATKRIDNKMTAFFLDGEEIILAIEGMTVKGRWRVVRIGAEAVMLEDGQTKKQQPLAISEEAGGTS